VLPSRGRQRAEGRQRLSLSLSAFIFSPLGLSYILYTHKIIEREERRTSFFLVDGRPKKRSEDPRNFIRNSDQKESRTKPALWGIRTRIKPLSLTLSSIFSIVYPRCILLYCRKSYATLAIADMYGVTWCHQINLALLYIVEGLSVRVPNFKVDNT
jgi:hypothetical protein